MTYIIVVYDGDGDTDMDDEGCIRKVETLEEVQEFMDELDPTDFYDGISKVERYKLDVTYKAKTTFVKECE